jgi:signal transduction histidine kinase
LRSGGISGIPVKLKVTNKILHEFPRLKRTRGIWRFAILLAFLVGHFLNPLLAKSETVEAGTIITTVAQLRRLADSGQTVSCALRLEGVVLWVSPGRDQLIFQDDSGGIRVEIDLRSQPGLQMGQKILLQGGGLVGRDGLREALVNNDGLHPATEKSAAMYLAKGRHPVRLDWFNALVYFELDVFYQGPGLPRQPIPDASLFRVDRIDHGTTNWASGLNYSCYQGSWEQLPDFRDLPVSRAGIVPNFDLAVRSQDTNVGIQFKGFIEIPRAGVYTFWTKSDDGSRLYIDDCSLRLTLEDGVQLPPPRRIFTDQPLSQDQDFQWSMVEGTITFIAERSGFLDLELNSGTGLMYLHVANATGEYSRTLLGSKVRVTGISQSTFTTDGQSVGGTLFVPGIQQIDLLEPDLRPKIESGTLLPILTKIAQVKSLTQDQARKGYPVKIRGVVTAPFSTGFFIQDGTWAIYVRREGLELPDNPRTGDYWEVDGTTYVAFSPNIQATRAVWLGPGVMPEPLHPTSDQFANGSLDTRYVEIEGVVTDASFGFLEMLTPEGRIHVQLSDVDPAFGGGNENDLRRYEGASIRVRGCAIPARDEATQQILLGSARVWLCNYAITIDKPAPVDAFSAPLKSVSELRLFNPYASILERVKVTGQILHQQGNEFYLWDGTNGLRFVSKRPIRLRLGDLVEVVGFPDLGGPSLILREAVTRLTGHAPLPRPRFLPTELSANQNNDGRLVRIRARLTDVSTESAVKILTLQAGAHGFVARLDGGQEMPGDVLPGIRVELTGVYASQSSIATAPSNAPAFELLLNSASDVIALEHPGWWTLQRLFAAFGVIMLILAGALLWIFTLKRQVHAQALMIHQKVEREATLEERARIARDIHDTLEQALAGTSLQLNALADSMHDVSQEPQRILKVARSMINHAQAEARRTVRNLRLLDLEKHNLPTALSRFATTSGDDSHVKIVVAVNGRYQSLPNQVENHLLRIGQEAVTNAIKHAGAGTVRIELNCEPRWLDLSIHDDGCGFSPANAFGTSSGHFGLLGMRERAEKIGGTFLATSSPGQGTIISVRISMPEQASDSSNPGSYLAKPKSE